ncbi:hypothetical protein FQN55_006452 [Onygenales sp. PD_40]|nr:hypothetical protein FQN55_006452 [Onygenales sp. PD_40]KAK2781689.1 hypothetical protein FQN53_000480 [Emmonsiellopsis sp. PD_33]KAK2787473.1 hypothetical protein FQN52_007191 [Onygenales sp. PD_12]KAK2798176.1 hypothetical protein FQN51_007862 [Onygenales sp. PD_10]
MAAVQLSFSIRTSPNVKTIHLLGSWDNYTGQLPLSQDASAKSGSWKGTFRFQGSSLSLGQRYWYYYIMDGYHVSHDPTAQYTVEPTTGRKLNILDVPNGTRKDHDKSHQRQSSSGVIKGRALSPSKIQHPKPSKPYASRQIRDPRYSPPPTVSELTRRFGTVDISDSESDLSSSPPSSTGSSISSRSSNTSPSSLSSLSDNSSLCSCERYGITRKGDRVKIDCGGSRCGVKSVGSSSDSDICSSSDSEEEYRSRPIARHSRHSIHS